LLLKLQSKRPLIIPPTSTKKKATKKLNAREQIHVRARDGLMMFFLLVSRFFFVEAITVLWDGKKDDGRNVSHCALTLNPEKHFFFLFSFTVAP
jgi:hypothetical protein